MISPQLQALVRAAAESADPATLAALLDLLKESPAEAGLEALGDLLGRLHRERAELREALAGAEPEAAARFVSGLTFAFGPTRAWVREVVENPYAGQEERSRELRFCRERLFLEVARALPADERWHLIRLTDERRPAPGFVAEGVVVRLRCEVRTLEGQPQPDYEEAVMVFREGAMSLQEVRENDRSPRLPG